MRPPLALQPIAVGIDWADVIAPFGCDMFNVRPTGGVDVLFAGSKADGAEGNCERIAAGFQDGCSAPFPKSTRQNRFIGGRPAFALKSTGVATTATIAWIE